MAGCDSLYEKMLFDQINYIMYHKKHIYRQCLFKNKSYCIIAHELQKKFCY